MKYLFVSSATTIAVVAIVIDGKIVYEYKNVCNHDMSKNLMSVIDEAFKSSKIKPQELNKIFVVTGPGSFTGIRVGLTVAKTMAWALKIPIVPISSLEMLASGSDKEVISLIDARRGYVYAGGYDKYLNNYMVDKYTLVENVKNAKHLISDDEFDFAVEKPHINVLKIIKKHENEKGDNPHSLKPNYLKNTEAEEKLNKSND